MWQRTEARAIFLAMYAPYYGLCNSSGSLAMFTVIRRASSLQSNLARAFGTKRTFRSLSAMSAFGGKGDMRLVIFLAPNVAYPRFRGRSDDAHLLLWLMRSE